MDGKTWRNRQKQEVSSCNRKVNALLKDLENWKWNIIVRMPEAFAFFRRRSGTRTLVGKYVGTYMSQKSRRSSQGGTNEDHLWLIASSSLVCVMASSLSLSMIPPNCISSEKLKPGHRCVILSLPHASPSTCKNRQNPACEGLHHKVWDSLLPCIIFYG